MDDGSGVPPADAVVEIAVGSTPEFTISSLHEVLAPALFASPLYTAIQLYVPTALVVYGEIALLAEPSEPSVTVTLWTAPLPPSLAKQFGLLGEYRLKVTVPVGLSPPDTCAVSWIWVPTGPPDDATVTIVGDACR